MRALVTGLCAGLATLALVARPDAQPAPDFARAKQLYDRANDAMTDGRYTDAIRDYGGAYDITKDPVLFFKIGTANEQAGKCDVALVYYARYLKEARPAAKFVQLTQARIAACGGSGVEAGSGAGSAALPGAGSAATTPDGSGAEPELGSGAEPGSGSGAEPGFGSGAEPGFGSGLTGSAAGSNAPVALGSASEKPAPGRDAPWLMVGGALAFVTAGAVLAYSASSSEQDLQDLYVPVGGATPVFDTKTAARYQDLVDEGHRYQYLSWGAFGFATGFGIAAAILFVRESNAERDRVTVTPTASPSSAGVSATVRF
jgi:hypothetical protein